MEKCKSVVYDIIKYLVDYPDDINIESNEENDVITLKVYVNKNDMGKIIGKNGKIAHSIRNIMKSYGYSINKKIIIKIEE